MESVSYHGKLEGAWISTSLAHQQCGVLWGVIHRAKIERRFFNASVYLKRVKLLTMKTRQSREWGCSSRIADQKPESVINVMYHMPLFYRSAIHRNRGHRQ